MACKLSLSLQHLYYLAYNKAHNFITVVAFGVALLFALLIFTELNLASAAETAVVPLKRRSKAAPGTAQDSMDEKKTASGCAPASTMVAETKRTHRGHLIRLYR